MKQSKKSRNQILQAAERNIMKDTESILNITHKSHANRSHANRG